MIIPCCDINPNCNSITWLFTTLPNGNAEAGYSVQLIALGVVDPAIYNVVDGSLPPGLSLSESGLISGTFPADIEGIYDFTVSVYDANKCYATQDFSIEVDPQTEFATWDTSVMRFGTSNFKWSDRWPY